MIALLIATRNAHKVEEIRAILGNQFQYVSLNDFPAAPEVVEDAGTFAGNAAKKAIELAKWLSASASVPPAIAGAQVAPGASEPVSRFTFHVSRLGSTFVLADDSGLEVNALDGAPGVHSARFAALDTGKLGNSPTAENNAKLLRLLKDVPPGKRTARFRCVLALTPVLQPAAKSASPVCYADEFELATELFEGTCQGRIEFALRGNRGFGYDPLFVPDGFDQTFGELSEEIKNGLSHRAQALGKLKVKLSSLSPPS
jgi:XTP/dITP diphosphohydrolase